MRGTFSFRRNLLRYNNLVTDLIFKLGSINLCIVNVIEHIIFFSVNRLHFITFR